jgi:NTE family protein
VTQSRRPRVGVVIGSGGIKCAAAIGLWKVLEREGIPIDLAVGCSGGSIYATAIALDWGTEAVERDSYRFWQDLFTRRNRRSMAAALFPRLFRSADFGIVDDARVNETIESTFGGKSFEQCSIPLYITATDLNTAEKVVISSGPLFDAVRGSIAIPFALRPWPHEGRLLCDGGVSDPLPVDVAIREGCDIILAMGFENALTQPIESVMGLALQTSTITVNQLLRRSLAFLSLAHHAEVIPIMPAFETKIGLGQTALLPYIIEQGERAAEREISYIKRLLAAPELAAR